MSKHTKGPWEFVDLSLVGPKIDDKPIWLRPVILRSEVGVNDADALLIAAAPDLLDALKKFEEYESAAEKGNDLQMMLSYAEFSKMAKAAIANATGGK